METEVRSAELARPPVSFDHEGNFAAGSHVIYAMHGKCAVLGIENRQLSGETIRFYKLEVVKSALSRSTRQEPAIWLPVATAKEKGLRAPMTREQAEEVLALLANREYYFQPSDAWGAIQPKLEAAIRLEGAKGLAKTISFLHVLKKKQIVPSPEVVKLYDNAAKLLFRELSEILGEPIRVIETRVEKSMRHKLLPDS